MRSKWPIEKLGKHIFQEKEKVGSIDGGNFPVYGVTNIKGVTLTGKKTSSDLSKYERLRSDRFVYNPYRINVGSIGLSNEEQDGIVSPAYVVFGTKKTLYSKYLYLFLKSNQGHVQIKFYGDRGTVRHALRFIDLCKIEIPVPPIEEQKRIVARIERLLVKIEEASRLRDEALEETEELMNSALQNLNLSEFEVVFKEIGECSSMKTGKTPPTHMSYYYGDDINWYCPSDLDFTNNGYLEESNKKLSYLAVEDNKATIYEKDTILLVAIGGSIGKVAISKEKCSSNQQITGMKFNEEIEPRYGYYWIRNLFSEIVRKASQATLPIINQQKIGSLEIKYPKDRRIQRRIVNYLDSLQARVDELEKLQDETEKEIEELIPSILDKAFKGEL